MSEINYNTKYGIFSEDGRCRLDIGSAAVKQETAADHDSWATRLVIKRLDGPNSGPVSDQHVVGIFSEDGRCRLDIGSAAMKEDVPANRDSWATRLMIRSLTDTNKAGSVLYGDVVGIFSEDGRRRLDIGSAAVKQETAADHDSWATRLRIQDVDPIVDFEISHIEYDTASYQILQSGPSTLFRQVVRNDSGIPQTSTLQGSITTSETSGWSDALGFKVGVKTSFKTGVPCIAEGKVEVSAEVSNTYTWNGSTTESRTWGFSAPVTVPPNSVMVGLVSITISTISVPYSMKGTTIYKSGLRVPGEMKGVYIGTDSHDLTVSVVPMDPRRANQIVASSVTPTDVTKS